MTSRADLIAQVVLAEFEKLPAKRKPVVRDNGLHEWVPLSAIVSEQDGALTCIALATGMKCLPAAKIPSCKGIVLHDCHAEVLAIRTFNRYLLDECSGILAGGDSILVERNGLSTSFRAEDVARPFKIKDEINLHMYCSEAPCGDASMELTMAAQEDDTPWPEQTSLSETASGTLAGREGFSQLGIVRRKPGRRDSPPTLSKSCSDKLALKQCTSLLSSMSSLFVDASNAYISTLVVPSSQYSPSGFERSFSSRGRMKSLAGRSWTDGFSFRPFEVLSTDVESNFSRRIVGQNAAKISPSNISTLWCASDVEETLLGGVIQGRKTTDMKGASRVSRRRMWLTAKALARQLGKGYDELEQAQVYGDIKLMRCLEGRRKVIKDAQTKALCGWTKNTGDSDFHIDQ